MSKNNAIFLFCKWIFTEDNISPSAGVHKVLGSLTAEIMTMFHGFCMINSYIGISIFVIGFLTL